MASLLAIGGTALVNAIMFSRNSAAFSMLGDHGRDEAKQHNLAIKKVAKERKSGLKRDSRDWTISTRGSLSENMLRALFQISKWLKKSTTESGHRLSPLRDEPKLSDFYNPSRQQKDAEIVLAGAGMSIVGLLAYTMKK